MPRFPNGEYRVVLFDLDGTLVDTAPDMVGALQELQAACAREPIDYELGRSHVSNGALGLLRVGFPDADDAELDHLLRDYLQRYGDRVCDQSSLFDGLEELLARLDEASSLWGIVTNKPAYLTEPLLELLALATRSACTVSGDTLTQRKPHPAQLLHACALVGVPPREAVYVGDASRDIEAGRAAGMATVAAAYGYITRDDDPGRWKADRIAGDTEELAEIVGEALRLP